MTWAPDYAKLTARRLERLRAIRADEKLLAAHLKYYATHPVEFIEDWFVTYDPRRRPPVFPFVLFEKQQDSIRWLCERFEKQQDGLIEKSRDMGVTWLCVAFSIWLWRFRSGVKIGFGSRKEMLVDRRDDPDSIFEKARIVLRNLPREVLPTGFDVLRDAPYLRIVNVENASVITGEAGDQIGRGGRSSIYFKDESAFYEHPERIEAALSQNSQCKIDVSTPNGTGNPFYRKRHSGKFPVFTFHWRDDPRKDDAWYEKQKQTLEPFILAQEVDIDYTASVEDICIPGAWVQAAVGYGNVRNSGVKIAALDVGGGRDRSVFLTRQGGVVADIEAWGEGDTTNTAYRAIECARRAKAAQFFFDAVGIGAGVASTFNHTLGEGSAIGVNVGSPPSDDLWADGMTSAEKFANLKAEIWWKMREMFRATFEAANGKPGSPDAETISIPAACQDLITQLSQPRFFRTDRGKIIIESKDQLKKRGISSPDFADALALTFAGGVRDQIWLSPQETAGLQSALSRRSIH
jgi:hypothetical protein